VRTGSWRSMRRTEDRDGLGMKGGMGNIYKLGVFDTSGMKLRF